MMQGSRFFDPPPEEFRLNVPRSRKRRLQPLPCFARSSLYLILTMRTFPTLRGMEMLTV